ncbi:Mg(2+) transport ATPase protein C [Acidisarcina polymorpha]|uniref:Protein MgtC n=1 Tax=Acidisarcina polymorpha TaxID=2211140 RepID=A0A2Z5FWL2_9BACT|nr:MgtC/SapB family protein [Acidisarcina polymorpha]AXC10904.1 Mg(2+) transport ATPase protein C [Acidisarcina polymorpha]
MRDPWLYWWTDSVPLLHQSTFPRLLLALCLGAIIGAERQWRQRAAGLRTNTLVCFGAAAFVDLGSTVAPGSTQIIAYVVSGVGFLGAGAIMKDGGNVRGLNTAATLWCSAAVGACAGAGEMLDACFVTAMLIGINIAMRPLSRSIDRRSLAALDTHVLYRLRLLCPAEHQVDAEFQLTRAIAARSLALRDLRAEPVDETDTFIVQALVESSTRDPLLLNKVADEMRAFPWINSIDWTETESETE